MTKLSFSIVLHAEALATAVMLDQLDPNDTPQDRYDTVELLRSKILRAIEAYYDELPF